MDLVNRICLDLGADRVTIVKRYLLPLILEEKSLANVSAELVNTVFSVLDEEEIEILKGEIEEIIGEEIDENFLETDWKVGKCEGCEKIRCLTKCKNDHDDDCEYSEITQEEGCNRKFCDSCIFHTCETPCNAIRCKSCSEF
jgi:hypothetical protein